MDQFRFGCILSFFILHIYWRIKHKGINKIFDFGKNPLNNLFNKSVLSYTQFFILLQLTGLTIFPITNKSVTLDFLAFILVTVGLLVCITARQSLGKSWTNAKDFKDTQNFSLVEYGIYKYIRHPIYLGLILMTTGAEILAHSYIILLIPLLYIWIYRHSLKEEKHLTSLMKQKYENYKNKTGMFIPKFLK